MTSPTLGTLFGYDVVHEVRPIVKICRIPTENGLPIEQAFWVMTPQDGALGLPEGPQGPPGADGEPSAPWKLQPDAISDPGDLPDWLTGDPADKGKAYIVGTGDTRSLYFWDGTEYIVFPNIVVVGPAGPAPTLTGVSVEMLAVGETPTGVVTGSDGEFALHLGIPAEPGPEGPQGQTVINASSFTTPPDDGDLLAWDATESKLSPVSPVRPIGPFTLPASAFSAVSIASNNGTTRMQVASIQLPAVPFAYRTLIQGFMEVKSGSSTRIDMEVRVSNAATGALFAYGSGRKGADWDPVRLMTAYDQQVDPLNPANTVGVLPANTSGPSTTLYVSVVKVEGVSQSWQSRPDRAQLAVWMVPVA